jgi:hypothetical protein
VELVRQRRSGVHRRDEVVLQAFAEEHVAHACDDARVRGRGSRRERTSAVGACDLRPTLRCPRRVVVQAYGLFTRQF